MDALYDKLRAQIVLINKAIKRDFSSDPSVNEFVLDQLTKYLEQNGTYSILDIAQFKNPAGQISFFYNKKNGIVFPQNISNAQFTKSPYAPPAEDLFYSTGDGNRFNYLIYLKFTPDGYPVFLMVQTDSGSDWVAFRTGVLFVGSFVVGFALPALGASIGQAVLGAQTAAAYPALANAIGNAAVNSVLNGGDVKSGVTSAISGVGSGAVGAVVAQSTTQAIGAASAAATQALLTGGDLKSAVLSSALQSGIKGVSMDLFPTSTAPVDYTFGGSVTPGLTSPDPYGFGTTSTASTDLFASFGTGISAPDLSFGGGAGFTSPDLSLSSAANPFDFGSAALNPPQSPAAVVSAPSGGSWDSTLQTVSSLAAAALRVFAPQIAIRAGLVKSPSGQSAQANPNGTVTVRNANGQVSTSLPPPGVAYAVAGGGVITNNGDGTYTSIDANGNATKHSYSNASGMNNALMYGGIALLAFLALK